MSEWNTRTEPETAKGTLCLMRRLRGLLMFVDLPIKKKFLLFAGSTLLWFCVMAAVAVVSMTAIHYEYYQVSEHVVPYRQAIDSVLTRLNDLDHILRQMHESSGYMDPASLAASRKQVEEIRATFSELSLRQTSRPVSGTIVEQILQNMTKTNPEGLKYLQDMVTLIEQIDRSLNVFQQNKIKAPANSGPSRESNAAAFATVHGQVAEAVARSTKHLERISIQYKTIDRQIYQNIRNSVHTVIVLLIFASLLLVLFTHWLIVAFYKPIKTITNQIESLGTGDIDLAKKVSIPSKDEIGILSRKFNSLMESVHGMTIYKKVIEEDSSLEEVYYRLGKIFSEQLGIRNYTIYEVNTQLKEMRSGYPLLAGDVRLHCHDEILTDCNLCRAVKTGHNVSSFEFNAVCRYYMAEEGVGHVCVPMMLGGNTGGVVQFRFPIDDRTAALSGTDAARLFKAETYIDQSLSVLEAKRLMQTLRQSSLIDPLTGLYNRRFLQEHTGQIISGVLRRGLQVGLLVCDLDYFKQVNDTHGHDIGDLMLKETATILKSSVREADLVIRFGGEEFLVLLLDTETGAALEVAEKIRSRMEEFKLRVGEVVLQKSISIGVSEFPGDTDGFWQAIKYADVAMYQAKETGRNRVVRFLPDMWQHGSF